MTNKKPIPIPRKETDVPRLVLASTPGRAHLVEALEVRPGKQSHVSLGDFTVANPPKGFSLEITPDYDPEAIVTQVTSLGATYDAYELVLHVANYGDRTVSVEVFAA